MSGTNVPVLGDDGHCGLLKGLGALADPWLHSEACKPVDQTNTNVKFSQKIFLSPETSIQTLVGKRRKKGTIES